jgi:hypothetical protein
MSGQVEGDPMKSSLVMFAAQEAEQAEAAGVAVSPYVLGAITLAVFVLLLLVTYGFRNVHTRH